MPSVTRGDQQRLGAGAAAELRAAYYFDPLVLMQAALAEDPEMAATVSNLRQDAMGLQRCRHHDW